MQPRKKPWMALILLLILLVIGAAGFIVAARLDQQQSEGIITGQEGSYGELPRITWQGATYRQKSGIHTILVVGYDKSSTDERVGFRDGGQCDFLMLLVINDHDRTVRQHHHPGPERQARRPQGAADLPGPRLRRQCGLQRPAHPGGGGGLPPRGEGGEQHLHGL